MAMSPRGAGRGTGRPFGRLDSLESESAAWIGRPTLGLEEEGDEWGMLGKERTWGGESTPRDWAFRERSSASLVIRQWNSRPRATRSRRTSAKDCKLSLSSVAG